MVDCILFAFLDVQWKSACGRTVQMNCPVGKAISVMKALHRRTSGCGFSLPIGIVECIKDVTNDLAVCQGKVTCSKTVPAFSLTQTLLCVTTGDDYVEAMYACI